MKTNSQSKPISRKIWVCSILIILGLAVIIYNLFIVRTVDSGNGYKHQIGHFGECYSGIYTNCEEATHRIHAQGIDLTYCERCWEAYGKEQFEELSNKTPKSSNSSKDETNAKICAEQAVKDQLKSPSSAKFCKYTEMVATNLGGKKWKVTGYVDAENSFGAMLRQNWTVRLTLTDKGFTDYTVDFS